MNVEFSDASQILRELSVVEGKTVLPLMQQQVHPRKISIGKKLTSQTRQGIISANLSYLDFGVDLAFAVTYHKVQGRTLESVIIDANSVSNLSVASIYVAISRTRSQDDIRLLPFIDGELAKRKLEDKSFDQALIDWLAMNSGDHAPLGKEASRKRRAQDVNDQKESTPSDSSDEDSAFQSQRSRIAEQSDDFNE